MQVAVIISNALGRHAALHALAAQGGVAAVAVPRCAPEAETDALAQQVAALGLPVTRLTRARLGAEPAADIERLVQATNPWNRGALTTLRGQRLRLLGVTPHSDANTGPTTPGTVLHADATARLWVAC